MRLIKAVLQNTFAGLVGPLTSASGLILPAEGTASAPGLYFKTENTLGLYRAAAGEIGIAGRLVGQGALPIGAIFDFAGPTPPPGSMTCDGQALSTTQYPELFAAIGYTWGGSGTTFYLPNLMDRYRRHRSTAANPYGGALGTLQSPCNLSHYHNVQGVTGNENQGHQHGFSGTTQGMNANNPHAHPVQNQTNIVTGNNTGSGVGGGGAYGPFQAPSVAFSIGATDINHGHSFSGVTDYENANHNHNFNVNSGGGSADSNEARPYSATVLTCIRVL
ncbi:tail fiber protein [Bradyrhizobium sp. ARR65]|uniref:tail fiber protein n=1 Tax=Bradyrhizobium sp. ARR65 TaxID=1040989 RepID=UPI0004651B69|nr:tail fiber protein [Bradyrhizobium sp. ARR65]